MQNKPSSPGFNTVVIKKTTKLPLIAGFQPGMRWLVVLHLLSFDNIFPFCACFYSIDDAVQGNSNDITPQSSGSGLLVGVCSQQGKRPYQEDEYAVRTLDFLKIFLFSIFFIGFKLFHIRSGRI
jgi:hypothetical protein